MCVLEHNEEEFSCAFTLHNGNTSCPIYFNPSHLHVTLFYHVKCLTWIAHNFNTCNCLEIILHLRFPYFIICNLVIKEDKVKKNLLKYPYFSITKNFILKLLCESMLDQSWYISDKLILISIFSKIIFMIWIFISIHTNIVMLTVLFYTCLTKLN